MTSNGDDIFRVNSYKFLGIIIDETLKFDVYINKICTKVSQSIGVIIYQTNF